MSAGRFIAVVGPSGVGKDSVMQGLAAAHPHLTLARRVITREADAGGEDFDAVPVTRFEAMRADGAFALSWGAHGLLYGIPVLWLERARGGEAILANLSRGVLGEAQALFPALEVLHLTAEPEVLAARLAARGREDEAARTRRLARSGLDLPPGLAQVHRIDNSGALSATIRAATQALFPAEREAG